MALTTYWRLYLTIFYVIGVSITTLGGVGIITFSLIMFGVLALAAIEASLFTNDQGKLDRFVFKVKGLSKITIAIIITALIFKMLI
ncbi:hypothetical protein [Paenibacillus illinoisensis]|uniref:hypothetical protein n=1 Tax=Paenibacillus illinoisensis TaxID=59845 RepID=UPI001C8E2D7F|nr:hypothetical protein [Paenibacillus illinoisensis]MBY0218949.1 hypothetical protein [Paenibacillus illinoisensis]